MTVEECGNTLESGPLDVVAHYLRKLITLALRPLATLAAGHINTHTVFAGKSEIWYPFGKLQVIVVSLSLEIRLLTYNIHGHKRDLTSLCHSLKARNLHVIAVQELSEEAADRFRDDLSDDFPHQALHPSNKSAIGLGLLSRHPIVEESYYSDPNTKAFTGRRQRAVLDVCGQTTTLYNVHPPAMFHQKRIVSPGSHKRAVDNLLGRAGSESGPVILAGDFNMTRQSREYRRISDLYRDAFRESGRRGFCLTYPSGIRLPFLRMVVPPPFVGLDFVFHNDWFKAVDAQVVSGHHYSDHLPLLAVLSLNTE